MEITKWYTISLGALVALLFVYRCFIAAASTIPKLLRGEGTNTRLHSLLILLYVCGNLLCVAFRATDTAQLRSRSGLMSLVNLIPLCIGGRVNVLVDFCGLSYENYSRIHRWIGRIAVIQGLIHAAISLVERKSEPGLVHWQLPGILVRLPEHLLKFLAHFNLQAAGGMVLLLLFSLFFIRRLFYEIFLKLHLLLAVATVVTLWYHVLSKSVKIYLIVGISISGTALALRAFLLLYRNFSYNRFSGRAEIQQLDDAVQISMKVRGSLRLNAGQYVYLYTPGVSFWAWLQSHPFVLAWWHRDEHGNTTVVFLIQPRKGLTRKLSSTKAGSIRAFIEGPYGFERDLGSYGTVIMFATGIGIAAQLPYLKSLLEGHDNRKVRTQRISLHWQLEKECENHLPICRHQEWVGDWMDELLAQDNKHKLLDISLYVLGQEYGSMRKYGERLTKFYRSLETDQILKDSVKQQKGGIVITVCTDSSTKNKICKTLKGILTMNIQLEELDFHPPHKA